MQSAMRSACLFLLHLFMRDIRRQRNIDNIEDASFEPEFDKEFDKAFDKAPSVHSCYCKDFR